MNYILYLASISLPSEGIYVVMAATPLPGESSLNSDYPDPQLFPLPPRQTQPDFFSAPGVSA